MYGHNGGSGTAFPHSQHDCYYDGVPMPAVALPFGTYKNNNNDYHHHLAGAAAANNIEFSNNNNSCSSGCSSYGGSPTYACSTTAHDHEAEPGTTTSLLMMQRSVSSHSLHKNVGTHRLVSDLLELETGPVRRVYSTGDLDLQMINISNGVQAHSNRRSSSESSPLSSESNMIIEGMSKACRYSPEEKKERIERYRNKRNLRNFNKTIKYACRKTLADSRPRIRGRFARNDEIDQKNPPNIQWNQMSGEEDEEDGDSWINLLDAFSSIESNSLI